MPGRRHDAAHGVNIRHPQPTHLSEPQTSERRKSYEGFEPWRGRRDDRRDLRSGRQDHRGLASTVTGKDDVVAGIDNDHLVAYGRMQDRT